MTCPNETFGVVFDLFAGSKGVNITSVYLSEVLQLPWHHSLLPSVPDLGPTTGDPERGVVGKRRRDPSGWGLIQPSRT